MNANTKKLIELLNKDLLRLSQEREKAKDMMDRGEMMLQRIDRDEQKTKAELKSLT